MDDLFFRYIQCGESCRDITLILDITWKILDELFGGLDSGFMELFDIDVCSM